MASKNKDHQGVVNKIYKILLQDNLRIDKRVVDAICYSSSEFTADRMRDGDDSRPIRWRYWGIFAIRNKLKKRKV